MSIFAERLFMYRYIFVLFLIASACNSPQELSAEAIIDKAIAVACNGNCDSAEIKFTFRENLYKSRMNNGRYTMERISKDSLNEYRDVITNDGFQRFLNDSIVKIEDSISMKLSNSVNSVHYFAQLPYGLDATSVLKKKVGEATIKGKDYYKIEVRFKEEGGGTDFDDVFLYWIHKENFTVDYMAYSYNVNGGGIRFREAYNPRIINGIRFVDYKNYKPESLNVPLNELDELFQEDKLSLLSLIETEDVAVELLTKN